ncbi:hypothetical protein [Deinococcus yavapaiensis]|uniref:Uncharacterized protein n=1 Tax=Deinococcus yavapaiensis KR-236 TaxID=694435 RepID=A0A318S0D4_9DEIO|nr:hypothetical protein [Deinococcus yavapaiensis]PYE48647.1 hypothetical protein DES52_1287 [Deinococcus yavapaiensis KR-236]
MREHPSKLSMLAPKIRLQLRIFSVLALIMLIVLAHDLAISRVRLTLALGGAVAGWLVGWLVGRTTKFRWDEEESRVVSNTDWFGALVLAAYLAFTLLRTRLVGVWVEDVTQVASVSLALGMGSMIGRIHALGRGIRRAISAWRSADRAT